MSLIGYTYTGTWYICTCLCPSESGQTTFCYVGIKSLGFKERKGKEHFERLISRRLLTLSQNPERDFFLNNCHTLPLVFFGGSWHFHTAFILSLMKLSDHVCSQWASLSFNTPRLGRVSCEDSDPLQRRPQQTYWYHPSVKGQNTLGRLSASFPPQT